MLNTRTESKTEMENNLKDNASALVEGHVLIKDTDTGEVLLKVGNHPKAVGSSPFYIHEYVFSSKFLRNCDASKHIRFLKRTQAVNSTNKYLCVPNVLRNGSNLLNKFSKPFLFPWHTKIRNPNPKYENVF